MSRKNTSQSHENNAYEDRPPYMRILAEAHTLRQYLHTVTSCLDKTAHFNTWPRGRKTFFMLNLVEHEIVNAGKYKYIKKFGFF